MGRRSVGTCFAATVLAAAGTLAIGCIEDVGVTSRLPAGAPPRRIVVLGIYENGRMVSSSDEARFTRWLGDTRSACPAAYGPALFASQPKLSAAIDDYALVHGPSAELLERLAPAAQADAILVIVLSRYPSEVHVDVRGAPGRTLAMGAASGAAALAGGAPIGGFSDSEIHIQHDPTVQAEALVYAVPERRWIGSVGVSYDGKHPGKAMTRFEEELAARLYGARCGAWDWNAPVEAGAIARAASTP
jgi:hypothetical protein